MILSLNSHDTYMFSLTVPLLSSTSCTEIIERIKAREIKAVLFHWKPNYYYFRFLSLWNSGLIGSSQMKKQFVIKKCEKFSLPWDRFEIKSAILDLVKTITSLLQSYSDFYFCLWFLSAKRWLCHTLYILVFFYWCQLHNVRNDAAKQGVRCVDIMNEYIKK